MASKDTLPKVKRECLESQAMASKDVLPTVKNEQQAEDLAAGGDREETEEKSAKQDEDLATGGDREKTEAKSAKDKEEHSHTFTFHDHSKTTAKIISCKKARTVLEALKTSPKFTTLLRKNKGKDIIIEKQKPVNADIATHFPCWLIEKDEELTIQFSSRNKSDPESPERGIITEESKLITFYFERTGGDNCKSKPLLKNKIGGSLLCIYACEGETAEEALQRDGRFTDIVFQRDNELEYFNKGKRVLLEINVPLTDEQDGKTFRLIMERKTTTKTDSGPQIAEQAAGPAQEPGEPTPSSATSAPANPPAQEQGESTSRSAGSFHALPDSEELLQILRSQFEGLVKHMKDREKVKGNEEVLELLREEYGKNIKVFWDVYRVKNLMKKSRSVCVLINNTINIQGTGFLLFDRFILTNAHLIKNSHDSIDVNFCYEIEHITTGLRLPIKEVIDWAYEWDEEKCWLDYALLELSVSTADLPPPLLTQYGPPIQCGGLCIIGHPESGVKRVDFCSVIESRQRESVVEKNKNLIQWIKWDHRLVAKDSQTIAYDTCFFHGSSGSPVFDVHGQVVAMHTGGCAYKLCGIKSVIEYAIPLQNILKHFLKKAKERRPDILLRFIEVAQTNKALHPLISPYI